MIAHRADPDERAVDVALTDQLRDHGLDGVRGDRKADADVAARRRVVAGLDLRVDADHVAAPVQQRPARVAVVDRRVGLDDVVDRVAVRCGDRALDRADDPGGNRAVETERVADRDDGVAHLRRVGVAERERRQRARARVDLEDGEVARRIGADDGRLHARAVREADPDLPGALDDVVVRDDVAGLVDDEAGAERLLLLLLGEELAAEERVGRDGDDARRGDLDDARRGAAVDVVDRERRRRPDRRGGRGCRRADLADRRRLPAEPAGERGAAEGEARAERGGDDEPERCEADAVLPRPAV